ncbi:AAEL017533-PA [Aedes aegypti]|uniref:AAEL017533-PA n=1 Tax=Aedes aegypti TaxID=7159 RepID=J9HXW6_AEDAE|nr:AAEL017533-PA [Aedes aegypti]
MKGYYKNEQATQETIDAEGWLHSGDTGYFDDEEDFFIVDRIKDLIKYKGFQVAPAEVEDVLLSHPKIRDAAVVGIPDENSGELPAAFVVLQDGVQELSATDVQRIVASKLSAQKHIRGGVYFVQEIPKTGSGKILRRELKDRIMRREKSKL